MLASWTATTRSVVALLWFATLCALTFLAVFALTPGSDRTALLHSIGSGLPAFLAGIPGVLAWVRAGEAAKTGAANRQTLLNGELDPLIQENVKAAIHEYMGARDPGERYNDPKKS